MIKQNFSSPTVWHFKKGYFGQVSKIMNFTCETSIENLLHWNWIEKIKRSEGWKQRENENENRTSFALLLLLPVIPKHNIFFRSMNCIMLLSHKLHSVATFHNINEHICFIFWKAVEPLNFHLIYAWLVSSSRF